MKNILFTLVMILTVSALIADEYATTDSGNRILIKEDGTWTKVSPPKTNKNGVRGTSWGMSMAQVKVLEAQDERSEHIRDEDRAIMYKTVIANMDTYVIYVFVHDKLSRVRYVFDEPHTNKFDYITDYFNLVETYEKKYGTPIEKENIWKNDLYRQDPQQYGMAVSLGHLLLYTKWNQPDSKIFMSLTGENYEVEFIVEYTSKKYETLEKNQIRKQKEGDI